MISKVVLLFLVYLAVCEALKCYECKNDECDKAKETDCKDKEVCGVKWNFKGDVERGCVVKKVDGFWTEHPNFAKYESDKWNYYQCGKDLCNDKEIWAVTFDKDPSTVNWSGKCQACKGEACFKSVGEVEAASYQYCLVAFDSNGDNSTLLKSINSLLSGVDENVNQVLEITSINKENIGFKYSCKNHEKCNSGDYVSFKVKGHESTTTTAARTPENRSGTVLIQTSLILAFVAALLF